MSDDVYKPPLLFAVINEIAIINQLTTAVFTQKMPPPLSLAQFGVLNHLRRVGEGTTPKKLARAFQVANTTMSHTVSLLHKNGFIELKNNPQDKRSKTLWLTQAGKDIHQAAILSMRDDLETLNDALALPDIHALWNQLAHIRVLLDEQRM